MSSELDPERNDTVVGSSATGSRLKKEVDSWRPYAEALRQEDREVFRDMMNAVSVNYAEAVQLAERGYDTEAVMMSVLLTQQKTINWLWDLARRLREERAPSTAETRS